VIASAASLAFGGWFERYVIDDLGNLMRHAGHTALDIGKHVVKAFHDLPGDVADMVRHPSWENLGKLGRDLATVAAVLTLVVAPFAAPAVVGILEGVAVAGNVAATGADFKQGKKADVAWDLLGLVPASRILGVGRKAVKGAEGDLGAARTASSSADGAVLDNQVRAGWLRAAGAVEADRGRRIAGAIPVGIGSTPEGAIAGWAAARQAQRAAIAASTTRLQAIDAATVGVQRLQVPLEIGALRAHGAVHAAEHGLRAAEQGARVAGDAFDAGYGLSVDAVRPKPAPEVCHAR
jgi:hypothetical protein